MILNTLALFLVIVFFVVVVWLVNLIQSDIEKSNFHINRTDEE